ncbi:MAG: 30S ribosomal protein S7, partial [Bacteroidetes bacterium]|nr:30S ribosomal protein S7 [Bacteroidota bacterium]
MRKRRAERRHLSPDPKFNDILVSRFINSIMLDGKKTTARRILYGAIEEIERRTGQPGYEVFRKALFNAQP